MTGPKIEIDVVLRQGAFSLEAAFDSEARITALFGPSGAGKTTLLNLIAGLSQPDRGKITVNGRVLTSTAEGIFVPPYQRRIGFVFQDAQLFPHLTVHQNMNFGRWFTPHDAPRLELDLERVAGVLGIEDLLDRRPARLSGGEKQRVALARALLTAPALLLMDEPLSGLDDGRRDAILPLIEQVRDEFNTPIIYVTHRAAEVARLASKVIVLKRGRVSAAGAPATLIGKEAK